MNNKIKVVVDYTDANYNVIGLHHAEFRKSYEDEITYKDDILSIDKPIRGDNGEGYYEANYSRNLSKFAKRKMKYCLKKTVEKDSNFEYSLDDMKKTDPVLFMILENWDELNQTHYATDYLKVITKKYDYKKYKKILTRKEFKNYCRIQRENELEKCGIDISYNVGLFNTSKKINFLDKIRGYFYAKKQKNNVGAKMNSSLFLNQYYYSDEMDSFCDAINPNKNEDENIIKICYAKDELANDNYSSINKDNKKSVESVDIFEEIKEKSAENAWDALEDTIDIRDQQDIISDEKEILFDALEEVKETSTVEKIDIPNNNTLENEETVFFDALEEVEENFAGERINTQENRPMEFWAEFEEVEDKEENKKDIAYYLNCVRDYFKNFMKTARRKAVTSMLLLSVLGSTVSLGADISTKVTNKNENIEQSNEKTSNKKFTNSIKIEKRENTNNIATTSIEVRNLSSKIQETNTQKQLNTLEKEDLNAKINQFREDAIKRYEEAIIIGETPQVGDLLDNETFSEYPDGTGAQGHFSKNPDYTVDYVKIFYGDNNYEIIRTNGKNLLEILEEHPNYTAFSIEFLGADSDGLGFYTSNQFNEAVNSAIDEIIKSKFLNKENKGSNSVEEISLDM